MPWSTSVPTAPKPRPWRLTPPVIAPVAKPWKVKWTRPGADAGIGADAATLDAIWIPAADTGIGADRALLSRLTQLLLSDTGLGADRGPIVPELYVADAALGADLARPGIRPADSGFGVDLCETRPRYAAIDRAVGADLLSIPKLGTVANDTGLGRDIAAAAFSAHAPVSVSYTTPGTFTYAIPVWCTYIELVGVGGGEGGDSGSGAFVAGAGGAAGLWNAITLQRGVHIPWSATSLTVTVGDGGTGGPGGPLNTDGAGGSPVVWSYSGTTVLTCAGGDDGGSGQNGKSPGNYTYNGVLYAGGAEQTSGSGSPGNPPGGGGRGGNGGFGVGLAGGKGAPGAGYARARQ